MDDLRTELESVQAQLKELQKARFGKSSEKRKAAKMPPPVSPKSDPQGAASKRRRNAEVRDMSCEEEVVEAPAECSCGNCASPNLKVIGTKSSVVYEHVREHFRKRTYLRQTSKCQDCGRVSTAPAPERVAQKTRYAPSFVAHLIYMKWSNSMPLYRLEKSYRALGIPLSRSTMCDLVHRAAGELDPLYQRMCELVRLAPDVHADETTIRQQKLGKKAFLWVFVAPDVTIYRYATTRSGSVPVEVLGDSEGRLVVDQYTGYNHVSALGKRERGGCLAHARRNVFEQSQFPEAAEVLELKLRCDGWPSAVATISSSGTSERATTTPCCIR